jgi:hypothetical protein
VSLKNEEIRRLLFELNARLEKRKLSGELYLVGGAVMSLVHNVRPATKDLDGFFQPAKAMREIASEISSEFGLEPGWLNDAVKGYLSPAGRFADFLELSNLRVLTAQPEYLLAMKCLAMRLGREFHDESDIRYLLRYLNIESYTQAVKIITKYYPIDRFPQKTLDALEEILSAPR